MRSLLSICGFLFITLCATAQEKKNAVGLYTSVFNSAVNHHESTLGGGTTERHLNTLVIGAEYLKALSRSARLSVGIEYADHNMEQRMSSYVGPPMLYLGSVRTGHVRMLSLPILVRLDFLRYFYITTGAMIDFDLRASDLIKNQSGIGATAGVGVKYDFKSPVTLFAQPFIQAHHLVKFERSNEYLLNGGVKLGIQYRL